MKYKTKNLVTAGLMLAIGIILPYIFHATGINGTIFSPMHIPVLLAGLLLGAKLGFWVGLLCPFLNFLISGMPPVPMLWVMMVELSLYGIFTGMLYKHLKMNLMLSLIGAMVIGRLGGAFMAFLLSSAFGLKLNPIMFLKGATIVAWPGILIQLIFIPIIVKAYKEWGHTSV